MHETSIVAFLAHLVVADGIIGNEELERLAQQVPENREANLVIEGILADAPDKITLDDAVVSIGKLDKETRLKCLEYALELAYEDGFFDVNEQHMIDRAVAVWSIAPEELNRLKLAAQARRGLSQANGANGGNDAQRLIKSAAVTVLKSLRGITSGTLSDKIDALSTKLLLSGPDYSEAVAACAQIARHDFAEAQTHLEAASSCLIDLSAQIDSVVKAIANEKNQDAEDLLESLRGLQTNLHADILTGVEQSQTSLNLKERAMGMFTIAFLGKTKAGKSTLHAIITGEGFDEIGIGKQRTTRYNRSYIWKGLRIMDTPGIGAPQEGGELDAGHAAKAVDEADVICFVVSNDSQQSTALDFLKSIRDRNKPVVVLLNAKENLLDPARLKRFLKDPESWATRTDARSLRGHIERIDRYARERFTGGQVTVIPVHLLAARLAAQETEADIATELFRGSRIKHFLDFLRVSVVEEGLLRRSQTLLEGTRFDLSCIASKLEARTEFLAEVIGRLEKKTKEIPPRLEKARLHHHESLLKAIKKTYGELREDLWGFAEGHHGKSEADLKAAWTHFCRSFDLEGRLKTELDKAVQGYVADAKEYMEEVTSDFALLAEDHTSRMTIETLDTFSMGDVFGFLGKAFNIGSAIAFFIPGLQVVAIVGAVIGGLLRFIGGLFKSGAEKRREATQKLYNSLLQSVEKQEAEVTPQVTKQLGEVHQLVSHKLTSSLGGLSGALKQLNQEVTDTVCLLQERERILENAFAFRALNFARFGNAAPEAIDHSVVQETHRLPGQQITITTDFALPEKARDYLSKILGEEVVIQKVEEATSRVRAAATPVGH